MPFAPRFVVAALAGLFMLGATPAQADDIALALGKFNALRTHDRAEQFGLEYRFDEFGYNIRPIVGAFATTDGGAYGYAGFNWDVELMPKQLYLIPNFAVGAYHEGSGKDLGGALEFRSGIELAYQFQNAHRIGVALNHLSNASIYNKNPGTESVILTYSLPVGKIF